MRFSERYGYKPVREIIQIDSMNDDLRNALWNHLTTEFWAHVNYDTYGAVVYGSKQFFERLWIYFYKSPVDSMPRRWIDLHKQIRDDFFSFKWFEVYDFVEFVITNLPYGDNKISFIRQCNGCLEREGSGYRVVDGLFSRITTEEEVTEIERALQGSQRGPVQTHLRRALELLSDRAQPDYRNSIKESISAVESLVSITLGEKGTLGQLLKKLEQEINLHPALRNAFGSLYGYTSDEDGIRHAIMESKTMAFEDAKFFLVVCSAFVNFVNAKLQP